MRPRWSPTRPRTAATATRWSPTGAGRRASRRTSGPRWRRWRTSGSTDPRVPDHLETITAPDGGVPVALPTHASRGRIAPWWAIGDRGHAARHRAALRAAVASTSRTRGWAGAEAFCGTRSTRSSKTHPYEVEAAIVFLDAASRPRAGRGGGGAARRARARAGARRPAARGLLARARSTTRTTSPSAPTASRARVVHRRGDRRLARPARARSSSRHGGWPITWAVWTPAIEIEWSGLVTIAALKTLRAYGRV